MSPRIRVCGPLAVEWDDIELAGAVVGGARERRLLAILAAARGQSVPKDVIVERLWDRPPRNPEAAVDTAVSLLRRGLGEAASAVETARPGYRLACTTDLAELDAAIAAARWDAALALVRGEFLAGESVTDWVQEQRRELARRHVEVIVAAGEAAATRGDDTAAVGRFTAAVERDPLREDAHRGLMGGLARLGRSAEAIRAYERCRRALRDELGVDPDPVTTGVYEQILAGRTPATHDRPSRGDALLPFLGRRAELARLTGPTAACRVAVVLGEPGIGKSRLVHEALVRADVGRLRSTRCFRLVAAVPYAVLGDLAPDVFEVEEAESEGTLRPEAGAARLAARLIDGLADGTTIVIDDLQWADEPSLAVLGLMLRRAPAGLTVLATARNTELEPDGAPAQFVELAAALGILDRIELGPLAAEDVLEGGYSFDDWTHSGGHPLLLQERVRGGDEDLAALVLGRARAAGPAALELLRTLAVLGRPAPLIELLELTDLARGEARAAADRLMSAALLTDVGGSWDVRHDVIAELVYDALEPAARRERHARTLAHLEVSEAAPAALASHAEAAGAWQACITYSLAAGEQALTAYANREAAEHHGRALRVIAEHAPPGVDLVAAHREAVLGRTRALIVLARTDEAAGLLRQLPAGTDREEVDRLLLEADCAWAAWKPSRALPPARAALEIAQRLGDDALQGRVHAFIANPYGSLGELGAALEHIDAALALADRTGTPPPAVVVYRLGLVQHQKGQETAALESLEQCRRLAHAQHDERTLVFERVVRSWVLGAVARYGEALAALDDVGTIGRGEEAVVRGRVPNTRASLLFELGLVDMALDADEESLEIVQSDMGTAALEPRIHTLLNLATDRLWLGDPQRAADHLTEVERLAVDAEYARFRYLNRLHWVRGLLALEGGDHDAVLAAATQVQAMADRYDAPKYRSRAHMLRGEALSRSAADAEHALRELRAGIRVAEHHGFAALAEHGHRLASAVAGSTHHARRAEQWRARIVASVDGPLRARLR